MAMAVVESHPARWWHVEGSRVVCDLCPRYCSLHDGQRGFCYQRRREGEGLVADGYGHPTGFALDPVEKKPLNHFLPGTKILSFGTVGCNLGCKFCQNWHISKARIDRTVGALTVTPRQVVELAIEQGAPSIACTYNDPVIYAEYMSDIGLIAHEHGLKSVAVTAGYVTDEARAQVFQHVDAANVDLKGFTESFYRKMTLSHLEPVLRTLRWLVHESDIWTEITTLLIPTQNDSPDEIRAECDWIAENLGPDVPLHFTAFHPDFKLTGLPPTPPETVLGARQIAREAGLRYVYVGNLHAPEAQTTYCPSCGAGLIVRDWHRATKTAMAEDGKCGQCGTPIPGVWG